jgi:hypothetical protein
MLFQLEAADRPAGLWVVKAPCSFPVAGGGPALLRELAGADLCAWGVLTPAIGLVRFPQTPAPTDGTEQGLAAARIYQMDAGRLAFCSRYMDSAVRLEGDDSRLAKPGPSSKAMDRDAILLFALDAYLWHYDRTKQNPNALAWQDRIVAIDHDRAFHRIEAVDEAGLTPDYTELPDLDALRDHVAFPLVRQHLDSPIWDEFTAHIEALDEDAVTRMASRWPDELDRDRGGRAIGYKTCLVQFLTQRRGYVRSIVREVRDALA